MRAFVVSPPDPVISWEDAQPLLRVGGDDQLIAMSMITGATAALDGPDGDLGRALGVQTLEARFDTIETCGDIRLPYPPVRAIVSVSYLDANRTLVTVDPDDYELLGDRLTTPTDTPAWSGCHVGREVLRVQYTAGYDEIPANIRSAILMMVRDELDATPEASADSIKRLLGPAQTYR